MADVSDTVSLDSHPAVTKETHKRVETLVASKFASRLFQKDDTLWGPSAQRDASVRLNWIDSPFRSHTILNQVDELKRHLLSESITEVLLCGMGGSSLGPELLSEHGGGRLKILDSTHPVDVLAATDGIEHKLVVISSKSGTTLETRCHLSAVERAFESQDVEASSRICVITDPGSELEKYAQQRGYHLVTADPHLGGRFSIFSAYGIVPAVLSGASVESSLQEARDAASTLKSDSETNPALLLAAIATENAASMHILHGDENHSYAAWIEQLVAESTGKKGKGVLPILIGQETLFNAEEDYFALNGPFGAQILTWEVATTAMAWLLGVNPFDQPDVEEAKRAARSELVSGAGKPQLSQTRSLKEVLDYISAHLNNERFLVLQDYNNDTTQSVADTVQRSLRDRFEVPVTVNRGPRYLHSSGQLHKGGPKEGIYLQLLPQLEVDLDVPGEEFTFGQILFAQASGDAQALLDTSQPVFQVQMTMSELLSELNNRP